ncbi:hypothetical protein [Flagellimonas zhangzhouensis]|nr:hypothetical protein [Allomuricauda zhangzhouensis]
MAPLILMVIFLSCGGNPKQVDKITIAENYIHALNASDFEQLVGLFQDSIRFNEMEYIRTFDKEGYRDLFQWDSVFNPKYEILDIKEEGENLHLTISKECERMRFLHEAPFLSSEVMNIKEGKIYSVAIVEYVDFNDSLWSAKRAQLVEWTEKNHPELDGFLYDQTKEGAIKFQKAIQLFENNNDSLNLEMKN